MPAPSLVSLATKACIKNIEKIDNVGNFEYWQISHILAQIKSPEQLHLIETNSPHICGDATDLWKKFILRDFPVLSRDKPYAPKDPQKWYQVYRKYKKEQEAEIARDEEILRQTMLGIQKHRNENTAQIVPIKKLPPLPRAPKRFGSQNLNRGFKKETPSTLNFTSGSKTKMLNGQSVLIRARREAKEVAQMSKLAVPTKDLHIGRVFKAPTAMTNEYKIASQPALKTSSTRPISARPSSAALSPSLEGREARLKAIQSGGGAGYKRDASGSVKGEILIGSSDEESGDDLFDDEPKQKPKSRVIAKPRGYQSSSSPPEARSTPTKAAVAPPRGSGVGGIGVGAGSGGRSDSPAVRNGPPASGTKPMMPMRRKAPVDVFNRGAKKQRAR